MQAAAERREEGSAAQWRDSSAAPAPRSRCRERRGRARVRSVCLLRGYMLCVQLILTVHAVVISLFNVFHAQAFTRFCC